MRAAANNRKAVTLVLLFIGLVLFELFNFYTSKIALDAMLGGFAPVLLGMTLGGILAGAAWTIDVGGILRIFTPESGGMRKEPKWVAYAFGFWFLASIFNAFLTWWVFVIGLENATQIPAILADNVNAVAIASALFVWLVRFSLVNNIGTVGDDLFAWKLPDIKLPVRSTYKPKKVELGGSRSSEALQSIVSGLGTPPKPMTFSNTPPTKEDGPTSWTLADYQKAVGVNPRLKNKTVEEIARMGNVSERTVYRWKEQDQ